MTAGSPAGLLAPSPAADRPDGRRAASAKRDVAIVVPTYNEAENLPLLVDRIFSGLPAGARLIVVDDGSPDGTGALAARLAERSPSAIELVQRNEKLGLGTAYRAGFERALARGADYVVQMDADLSHDPDSLDAMLAKLRQTRTSSWDRGTWRARASTGGGARSGGCSASPETEGSGCSRDST